MVSNYSGKIFLLKGLLSLLMIVAAIISFKLFKVDSKLIGERDNSKKILHPDRIGIQNDIKKPVRNFNINELSTGAKKVTVVLCMLIVYLTITLTYSSNPYYGFQKILNFIISAVPSILVFYYLISSLTELRMKLFIYSISVITILTVSYILIVYPFDQSTIYYYKPGRWSHVIYGRMISSFAVVLILYLIWMIARLLRINMTVNKQYRDTPWQARKKNIKLFYIMFITSVAVYGTYLSALRAAFVGLILVGGGALVLSIFVFLKNLFTKNEEPAYRTSRLRTQQLSVVYSLLIIIILSALLILLVPKPDIVNFRFDNMIAIDGLNFKGDQAIHSRLDSWELSWKMIKEHLLLGTGLGGFNGYDKIEWTRIIRYSHNLFIETFAETGIFGLFLLFSLLFFLFKSTYRFSKCHPELVSGSAIVLTTFFIFALWLAMFSKEFSNQTMLWIGLAFVGLKQDKRSNKQK